MTECRFTQRQANGKSGYRFRKFAPHILGPFLASISNICRDQIHSIERQINRVTMDRRTAPSEADRALVTRHFEGQDIATLRAHDWPRVFL